MKKIIFILLLFLAPKLSQADQNVVFGWSKCIEKNPATGNYFLRFFFNTWSCSIGGVNQVVFWAYDGGTTYGPIPAVAGPGGSLIFDLPPGLNTSIANNQNIQVTYYWRCVTPGFPWGPNDNIDPTSLSSSTWQYKVWSFKKCDEPCSGDFKYCYDTKFAVGGSNNYNYEFEDRDNNGYYQQVLDLFNSTTCTSGGGMGGGPTPQKHVVVTDKWDFGDGSPAITSTSSVVLSPTSTFKQSSLTHTFTSSGGFNVCHTKTISIFCGYIIVTGGIEHYWGDFTQVVKCTSCLTICMPDPDLIPEDVTILPVTPINLLGAPTPATAITPIPCIGDFTNCAYTEYNDPQLHVLDDDDYNYLIPLIMNQANKLNCQPIKFGGVLYDFTPGYVVYDTWEMNNPLLYEYANSLDKPSLYTGVNAEPFMATFDLSLQYQSICHMKQIDIGCKLNGEVLLKDPSSIPHFIKKETVLRCTVCTDFCLNKAEDYNQHSWGKQSHITSSQINETNNLLIYPSPANDVLNIQFDASASGHTVVSLRDINGRILQTLNVNSTIGSNHITINTSGIANGQYIVEFLNDANKYTRKVEILR